MDKIFSGMHFSNNVWCRVWNEGRKKGKEEGKKDRGRDERKGRREREGERNGVESRGAAAAKSLQSCPTLCYPIDRSPPGSPVPGILQARTLAWVESEVAQSCPTLSDPMDCSLPGSSVHGIFQARVTGVGCHCIPDTKWMWWENTTVNEPRSLLPIWKEKQTHEQIMRVSKQSREVCTSVMEFRGNAWV